MKKGKVNVNKGGESVSATPCFYCKDLGNTGVKEVKNSDGAVSLELRTSKKNISSGFWNFLASYGYQYSTGTSRPLLPIEVLNILRAIPEETKKKITARGFFPQSGAIMLHLPVPPNCLRVPDFSDGPSIISYDVSHALLKRVLHKIDLIKRSRSGTPNFESHEAESSDLQLAIAQYLTLRGTTTGPQDTRRYVLGSTDKAGESSSNKQWLEKMKTLFISKGSGFSSRSVITGDPYIGINVIGLPSEIAKQITFEERVTAHNIARLQDIVDKRLCVTYQKGSTSYAISAGARGYTNLRVGQIVNRRIMDGDLVFVNRPPSTHKHSLQAFYVYVHDDHTVKINPLICSPFGADFDGDCIHIFYPQSLPAKAEALELFSVEKQLINSYNGTLSLQVAHDSLLGLKFLMKHSFLSKPMAQQLAMHSSPLRLQPPAVLKSSKGPSGPLYKMEQLIQSALPSLFESDGDRHEVVRGEITRLDLDRDHVHGAFSEIVASVFSRGSKEALQFMDIVQPMMMELLNLEGFSVGLRDFNTPKKTLQSVKNSIGRQAYLLSKKSPNPNQPMDLRVEGYLRSCKQAIADTIISSPLAYLMDTKSDSSITKVVQQLGFLGLQLYRQDRFYSRDLVEDCLSTYANRFAPSIDDPSKYPSEAYGLVSSSFYEGLNPFEELVHSISTREVIVRSSRGLTEPGTLFKNLMAVMRDVVICYDGTVRNMCSNSIIQFAYGEGTDEAQIQLSPPGEPVGVLAATAISKPAYSAVLDSSQSNNTSWELMKEVLLTKVAYKNEENGRRVILFMNDCFCGKKFCKERAALAVQSCLKKVKLKDCATNFSIEYHQETIVDEIAKATPSLVGHIHLDKVQLQRLNKSIDDVLERCQEAIEKNKKKKGTLGQLVRKLALSASECCGLEKANEPCLQFCLSEASSTSTCETFEQLVRAMSNSISPILLDTIIKGDPRVSDAKILWMGPEEISWVRNYNRVINGEVTVEVLIEKDTSLTSGDAWGITIDACLPVIDLIDIRRSTPYGIQQVKELLGISCAFEQVVQRLFIAVRGVAKGVMKDHLIVVANNMACTGNLNGFNIAGYKAMFRSLKIQVPFTEATLYTPMKCFDRAAEKCYSDTLDSVVSSCSWGKHVALGTGSAFQVLWDKKQLVSDKCAENGLYDFLSLVRTTTQKDADGSCLQDVDDLYEPNGYNNDNYCPSPEFDAFGEKPTFEDAVEETDWGKGKGNSWDMNEAPVADSGGDGWGGWGNGGAKDKGKEKVENGSDDPWGNSGTPKEKNIPWGGNEAAKVPAGTSGSDPWGTDDPWGNSGVPKRKGIPDGPNSLGKDPITENYSWANNSKEEEKNDPWSGNEAAKAPALTSGASEWENNDPLETQKGTWGKGTADSILGAWKPDNRADNESCGDETPKHGTWDQNLTDKWPASMPSDIGDPWGSNAATPVADNAEGGDPWGSNAATPVAGNTEGGDPWGSNAATPVAGNTEGGDPWGSNAATPVAGNVEGGDPWSSNAATPVTGNVEGGDPWSSNAANPVSGNAEGGDWGKEAVSTPGNDGWSAHLASGSSTRHVGGSNDGWGGPKSRKWNNDPNDSGGSGRGRGHGRGTRGGRPPRRPDGEGRGRGFSRPPPDPLTPEEEKILLEIEPLVQNIRRILREASDGEKLADEDCKFVTENVFEFHPDKQSKITDKMDHIMVNKHKEYQMTRCFFAVSSDGSAIDFSYKKCLENFVKQNNPEHGESFCAKYFKKPRNHAPNADLSQLSETQTQPTDGQTPQLPETPQLVTDDWTKDAAAHTVTDSWAKAEGGMPGSSEATPDVSDDWASK
ncbi:DNA-directed RNA polymerase V subunit 1-like isoform X2 [Carex rostrata]